MFKKYDYHIITEKDKSTLSLQKKFPGKVKYLIYGSRKHMLVYPFKFIFGSKAFKSKDNLALANAKSILPR